MKPLKQKHLPYPVYDLIPSQQAMYMMVKYSFHKQLVQIPVSFAIDHKIDFELLERAFNLEIERNDSLRLRFFKDGGKVKQYFLPYADPMKIPVMQFATLQEQESFFSADAQKPVLFEKETFRIIFFSNEETGGYGVYFVTSHLALDAMGIINMFFDLLKIYLSLATGAKMPKPLQSYENYIREEFVRLADKEKMQRHADFYKHYFLRGGEPMYAGVHGPEFLEQTRIKKKNPELRVPFAYNPLYDKSDFLSKTIPAEDAKKIMDYCEEHKISPELLLTFGLRTYCSAINYRTPDVFMMLLCSKRATPQEKRMGGCVAQPLQLRTIFGEEMTFEEAIEETAAVRTQLFRHSRYPYIAALQLSRDIYDYSAIQGPACMMFSWIPVPSLGVLPFHLDFRSYNLGRYFTPLYVISHPDSVTGGLKLNYMYRVKLSTKADMEALHENTVRTILAGIENPKITVGELLDRVIPKDEIKGEEEHA